MRDGDEGGVARWCERMSDSYGVIRIQRTIF